VREPETRPNEREIILTTDSDHTTVAGGRVTGLEGAPVAAARLSFEDDESRLVTSKSEPDGGWSVSGLHPGKCLLRADARAYLPHRETVTIPEAGGWAHNIILEACISIPVRLETPAGKAIRPGKVARSLSDLLSVAATKTNPGPRLSGFRTSVAAGYGAGSYLSRAARHELPGIHPRYQGLLYLKESPPLWVSVVCRDVVLDSRLVREAVDELIFVVDPQNLPALRGEVRVALVAAGSGELITEGVSLTRPILGDLAVKPKVEDGLLVFRQAPPGKMKLVLKLEEWELFQCSVDVPPGGAIDLGTMVVGRRKSFDVRLVDESGAPLSLSVTAVRPDLTRSPNDYRPMATASSGSDGVALVYHLAPGPTLLNAGGRDGRARVGLLVDTALTREPELVVPFGVEVVFRRDRTAWPGAELMLEDERGVPLHAGRGRFPSRTFLLPGRYRLLVIEDGSEIERVGFTVGSERTVVRYGGE
jgi:hypothetical protein